MFPEQDVLDHNIECVAFSKTPSAVVSRVPKTRTLSLHRDYVKM